ncbi:MAG: response regulator [Granulosicoccus sp.]|nr:response regulator [Granulosicoccus sp.]
MSQSAAQIDILIVEDDEQTHTALMSLVRRMGYEPRGACSIDEALEAVTHSAPEVLITDWDLGEHRSGIDVATRAKALRNDCKVVFCSGNNLGLLRQQTRHLEICRYIKKPISLTRLRDEVAAVLAQP